MALDIGAVRIGVALANSIAKIAHPLGALSNDGSLLANLKQLCERENVAKLVIGLPRDMSGNETTQTAIAKQTGLAIAKNLDLPFTWQDEAATSLQAESELQSRGRQYNKDDIDALSAVYILEDYLGAKL